MQELINETYLKSGNGEGKASYILHQIDNFLSPLTKEIKINVAFNLTQWPVTMALRGKTSKQGCLVMIHDDNNSYSRVPATPTILHVPGGPGVLH
jgi:hypothetical protein